MEERLDETLPAPVLEMGRGAVFRRVEPAAVGERKDAAEQAEAQREALVWRRGRAEERGEAVLGEEAELGIVPLFLGARPFAVEAPREELGAERACERGRKRERLCARFGEVRFALGVLEERAGGGADEFRDGGVERIGRGAVERAGEERGGLVGRKALATPRLAQGAAAGEVLVPFGVERGRGAQEEVRDDAEDAPGRLARGIEGAQLRGPGADGGGVALRVGDAGVAGCGPRHGVSVRRTIRGAAAARGRRRRGR